MISSPNAGWTEFLTDNADTFDEMKFLDIKCGENSLKDQLRLIDFENNTYNYNELTEQDSIDVQKLFIQDYSCNETGYLSDYMIKAGYATIMFEYSNQNMTVRDYAHDPIACVIKKVQMFQQHVGDWILDYITILEVNGCSELSF